MESKTGNCYYYGMTVNKLPDLVKQMMWHAKEDLGCDQLIALSVLDNTKEIFEGELGFLPDDGQFHWYLVNYALGAKKIGNQDIGAILL